MKQPSPITKKRVLNPLIYKVIEEQMEDVVQDVHDTSWRLESRLNPFETHES